MWTVLTGGRAVIKPLIIGLLASAPIYPWLCARLIRNRAVVLMYHEICDDAHDIDAWTVLRSSKLLRQIEFLRKSHEIVSLETALRRVYSEQPLERPIATLTFDDGYSGMAEVLMPILEREQIPATIYLATGHIESQRLYWYDRLINVLQVARALDLDLRREGFSTYRIEPAAGTSVWPQLQRLLDDLKPIEPGRREMLVDHVVQLASEVPKLEFRCVRPLTIDQVRALGASPVVTIGAHTHGHEVLTRISEQDARTSILRGRSLLQDWSGQEVRHFAYPSGACNRQLVRLIETLGFSSAVATTNDLWTSRFSRYQIPRIGIGRWDSHDDFRLQLIGGLRRLTGLRAR